MGTYLAPPYTHGLHPDLKLPQGVRYDLRTGPVNWSVSHQNNMFPHPPALGCARDFGLHSAHPFMRRADKFPAATYEPSYGEDDDAPGAG